jgi:glycosyltransferase involved in cell wall biosynthesis
MSAGLPIVATRVEGNEEAIANGIHGLTVPPGDAAALADAILSLLDNPALGMSLGARARERARQQFALEGMVESMQELYSSLSCEPSHTVWSHFYSDVSGVFFGKIPKKIL